MFLVGAMCPHPICFPVSFASKVRRRRGIRHLRSYYLGIIVSSHIMRLTTRQKQVTILLLDFVFYAHDGPSGTIQEVTTVCRRMSISVRIAVIGSRYGRR